MGAFLFALHLLRRFNHVLTGARILRTKLIYSDPSSHHKTLCIPPRLHFLTYKNRGSGQTPRKMTLLTVPGKPCGQRKNEHWHRVNGAQIHPAPIRSRYTRHLTCSGLVSLPGKWGHRGTSSDCGEDESSRVTDVLAPVPFRAKAEGPGSLMAGPCVGASSPVSRRPHELERDVRHGGHGTCGY